MTGLHTCHENSDTWKGERLQKLATDLKSEFKFYCWFEVVLCSFLGFKIFVKVVWFEMEWPEEQQFDLIREVRARPVIWDPRHPQKKRKNKKDDAFKEIAAMPIFEGRTFDELKKKFNSLCQSYRSYRRKAARKTTGMGTSAVYKPTWIFFRELNGFLRDVYEPRGAADAGGNHAELDSDNSRGTQEEEDDVAHLSDLEAEDRHDTQGSGDGSTTADMSGANADGTHAPSATVKPAGRTKLFKSPKKLVRKEREDAMKIACQYLQNKASSKERISTQPALDDECTTFGQLVAQKLRRMEYFERQELMNDINGVIFRHVMKHRSYRTGSPTTSTSSTSHRSSTPSPSSPMLLNSPVHSHIWNEPPSPISNYNYPTSSSTSSYTPQYSAPPLNLYPQSSSHPQYINLSQTPSAPQSQSPSDTPYNMSLSFNTVAND